MTLPKGIIGCSIDVPINYAIFKIESHPIEVLFLLILKNHILTVEWIALR
jgi:hypothetical protein|tara:strand:- start:11 stop:160 length:150 start_codon:yes stop_codon:yes gene_type:complete